MSKKKKHKNNKKQHSRENNSVNKSFETDVREVEQNLLAAKEDLVKLENNPVDLLSDNVAHTSEVKTEINTNNESSNLEFDFKEAAKTSNNENSISKQESHLKHDLEKEAHITLESEAEHNSHTNKTSSNSVPFWTGVIVGALLTFLFL